MRDFTIAIVSDLHAFCRTNPPNRDPPSHLCITDNEDQPTHHPITGLLALIRRENVTADVLLCAGDMTDKAHPDALSYVWSRLHNLKVQLGASVIAATAGNHDVDSRYQYNDFDAKGALQSIQPPFPIDDETLSDKYWSRNYAIQDGDVYRLLLLNSSAYHGVKDNEYAHGRISRRTVDVIRTDLSAREPKLVNIVLCHHHPYRYTDIDSHDYSEMDGGDLLLNLLDDQLANWIVIHGHKHHPRISYGPGGANAPVIFSAGSLCASLYRDLQTRARNQFYTIRFPTTRFDQLQVGLPGRFRAWDWIVNIGWQKAGRGSGLPGEGGFGCRQDIASLARELDRKILQLGNTYIKWEELAAQVPVIEYLIPKDFERLLNLLKTNYGYRILEEDGRPAEIARTCKTI